MTESRNGAVPTGGASFEVLQEQRSRVTGVLDFDTVTDLLAAGSAAILSGDAAIIDLSGVTSSDSAGLALLIEWLSVAREAGRKLRYENVSAQIKQIAGLSEVDELLLPV